MIKLSGVLCMVDKNEDEGFKRDDGDNTQKKYH